MPPWVGFLVRPLEREWLEPKWLRRVLKSGFPKTSWTSRGKRKHGPKACRHFLSSFTTSFIVSFVVSFIGTYFYLLLLLLHHPSTHREMLDSCDSNISQHGSHDYLVARPARSVYTFGSVTGFREETREGEPLAERGGVTTG